MAKVFMFIFGVVIVILGLWTYDHYIKSDFEIVKSSDWREMKAPSGVEKLYATSKDDIAISSANIIRIKKQLSLSEKEQKEIASNACNNEIRNRYGNSKVSEITLNSMPVVVCSFESKGENVDKILQVDQYNILNSSNKEYNYIVSISYPKDDAAEANKANEFISGFKIY